MGEEDVVWGEDPRGGDRGREEWCDEGGCDGGYGLAH